MGASESAGAHASGDLCCLLLRRYDFPKPRRSCISWTKLALRRRSRLPSESASRCRVCRERDEGRLPADDRAAPLRAALLWVAGRIFFFMPFLHGLGLAAPAPGRVRSVSSTARDSAPEASPHRLRRGPEDGNPGWGCRC
eukprot:scaffold712_cov404-Prasinococcus_capsulatus_cf.AAC.5